MPWIFLTAVCVSGVTGIGRRHDRARRVRAPTATRGSGLRYGRMASSATRCCVRPCSGPLTTSPTRGRATDVVAAGWDASVLTLGASVVFRAAESTDRRGGTWGEAQIHALQAVARFVAVIPDSLGLGAHLAIQVADPDQLHVLGVWLSSPVMS